MCELRSKVSEVELLSETERRRKEKKNIARKELKDNIKGEGGRLKKRLTLRKSFELERANIRRRKLGSERAFVTRARVKKVEDKLCVNNVEEAWKKYCIGLTFGLMKV